MTYEKDAMKRLRRTVGAVGVTIVLMCFAASSSSAGKVATAPPQAKPSADWVIAHAGPFVHATLLHMSASGKRTTVDLGLLRAPTTLAGYSALSQQELAQAHATDRARTTSSARSMKAVDGFYCSVVQDLSANGGYWATASAWIDCDSGVEINAEVTISSDSNGFENTSGDVYGSPSVFLYAPAVCHPDNWSEEIAGIAWEAGSSDLNLSNFNGPHYLDCG